MTTMNETDLRRRAERRADAKIGFQHHALIYAVVIAGLAALNLITSPGYLWFLWAAFGWGVGVAAHGFGVYRDGSAARERAIEAEMERLRRQGG